MLDDRLIETTGDTPEYNVLSAIRRDMKKKTSVFLALGNGFYALKEYMKGPFPDPEPSFLEKHANRVTAAKPKRAQHGTAWPVSETHAFSEVAESSYPQMHECHFENFADAPYYTVRSFGSPMEQCPSTDEWEGGARVPKSASKKDDVVVVVLKEDIEDAVVDDVDDHTVYLELEDSREPDPDQAEAEQQAVIIALAKELIRWTKQERHQTA